MRTKTANKLFSLLAAALMVVSNISPVRVLAEGETTYSFTGTEDVTVTDITSPIALDGVVSATYVEGEENVSAIVKVNNVVAENDTEYVFVEGATTIDAPKDGATYTATYVVDGVDTEVNPSAKTQKRFIVQVSATTQAPAVSLLGGSGATLGAPGPNNSELGISGYTSGDDWSLTDGKGLTINLSGKETGKKAYVKIEVAKGMRLSTFVWNDEWGTVATNVQGSKVAMGDSEKAFLSGNEISVDTNGNTILVYEIATGTESLNLNGKITVKPDEVLSYNNDEIPNAVKVSYLDENKAEVSSATYNVNAVDNPNENVNGLYDGFAVYVWGQSGGLYPGAKDVLMFNSALHRIYGGENYSAYYGTNRSYIYTLPDIVENVTKVTLRGNETTTFPFKFDKTSKVLTVNMSDGGYQNVNVYGDISATASEGYYDSRVESKAKIKFYDGVEKTDLELVYSNSTRFNIGAKKDVIVPERYNSYNLQRTNNPESGYPVQLIAGQTNNADWFAQEDLNDDQVITWSSDPNTVDIKYVQFPVGKEGNVTVTSVTFDDGYTYTLNATNIGSFQSVYNVRNIGVEDLKKAAGVASGNAKYIRSVTANCGTFDKGAFGYQQTGFPVGYFSEAIVNANKEATVPINYSVNGVNFTYDAIYSPQAMVSHYEELENPAAVYSGEEFIATAEIFTSALYGFSREPNLFVVVPDGFEFNPTKVTAKDEKGNDLSSKLKYTYKQVENSAQEKFDAYSFYIEDSVLSFYTDTRINYTSPRQIFSFPFRVSSSAKLGQLDLGDYIMVGKGEFDGKFAWDKGTVSYQMIRDLWDFNGDKNRDDNTILRREISNISVLEDKNISVSGYLTEKGKPGVVEAYNPGADGSSDVNAVTFTTGTEVDYHVVVKSTLDTNNTSANVRAYIPLPDANVSGGTSTPNNTGGSADERYQFGDYKWPMTLVSDINNPNSSIYKITYWLNEVGLDANGNPVATANTVTKSESEITSADYSKVVLVQIDGTGIPMNSETELKMTLKVNVNSAEALSADINGTKNIFRPYFYRTSDAGSGYNSGNYVAAKLEIGAIGGKVFLDVDGNGLYEVSKGDTALGNVTVQLLDESGSLIETKTTSNATTTKGDYRFENLSNGTYTVKVINSDTNRRFSKPVTDAATTYTINSDVTGATDHKSASYQISIPEGVQFDSAQLYINAGLVGKADVYVKAEPSQGGTLAGQTVPNFTKLPVGEFFVGYTIADGLGIAANTFDSLIKANTGYVFKNWKIGNNTYTTEELKKVVVDSSRIEAIAVFAEDKNNNGEDDTTEKFTVIFKDGNTELKRVSDLALGATVATYTPTKKDYVFDKWTPDFQNKVRVEDANRNSEIIYTATWKDDKNNDGIDDATQKFTVIFKDGNTELKKVEDLSVGAKVDEYKPTKREYVFDKWTPTFKNTVDASMADKNAVITYTASWKEDKNNDGIDDETQPRYSVTFKDGVGGKVFKDKVHKNILTGMPTPIETIPTRKGYDSDGWDPAFKSTVDADVIYTAKWVAHKYTISFSDEGADEGSAPADMNATFDTPLTAPDNTGNLKKKGHDFEGWEGPDGTIYKPGDELLNLSTGDPATVTLKPVWESFTYSYTQGAGNVWTKGSNATSDFRVTRSRKDELTFGNFKEVIVDGSVVAASNYTKVKGSVIIKLNAGYLEGLTVGSHTIQTVFTDGGSVSTTFTVKAKPQVNVVQPTARTCQDDGYPAGYYWNGTACVAGVGANRVATPNTGDGFNAWLYLSTGMLALAVAFYSVLKLKKHS